MTTASQSEFRQAAAKRFPFSARRRTITGDGKFCLVLKCTRPTWSVVLFQTRAERDRYADTWFRQCEHHSNCRGQLHEKVEFEISQAPVTVPMTYSLADRFPDKYDKD
jgi:hypothetical protein